jgi:hypothetical protein
MQEWKKIVYEDEGENKAVVGIIETTDEYFVIGKDTKGRSFQINKRHIVIIKDWEGYK